MIHLLVRLFHVLVDAASTHEDIAVSEKYSITEGIYADVRYRKTTEEFEKNMCKKTILNCEFIKRVKL